MLKKTPKEVCMEVCYYVKKIHLDIIGSRVAYDGRPSDRHYRCYHYFNIAGTRGEGDYTKSEGSDELLSTWALVLRCMYFCQPNCSYLKSKA